MTELETCGCGLSGAEECVVAKDVHGVLAAGAASLLREHLHTEAVPEHGTVVEAIKSLLESRDRHNQQPVAATLHL